MRHDFMLLVLSGLGVSLLASGCSQPAWPKAANPFNSASMGLPGANSSAFPPAAGNGLGDSLKNPLAFARLSESQGRADQAERLYLEISSQLPNNPEPHHRLAVMYTKQGRFKEAEERFGRALALVPSNPELLNDAGYFYYLAGNRVEAERCLGRAIQLQPENPRSATNLALLLGEQGRDDECLALFRRAAPMGNQAYLNFAYVLAQRGEYGRAMDVYDRVLTEDPSRRVAAEAMIELAKYTPRKTLLPPPAIPTSRLPQVACNPPQTGPSPPPGPAWTPNSPPVASMPPQLPPSAWASPATAYSAQPGYPPASPIPSYAPGPTNAAYPVSYRQ